MSSKVIKFDVVRTQRATIEISEAQGFVVPSNVKDLVNFISTLKEDIDLGEDFGVDWYNDDITIKDWDIEE